MEAVETYARKLRAEFENSLLSDETPSETKEAEHVFDEDFDEEHPVDALNTHIMRAIKSLGKDTEILEKIQKHGAPWKTVLEKLKQFLPDTLQDKETIAYQNDSPGPRGFATGAPG